MSAVITRDSARATPGRNEANESPHCCSSSSRSCLCWQHSHRRTRACRHFSAEIFTCLALSRSARPSSSDTAKPRRCRAGGRYSDRITSPSAEWIRACSASTTASFSSSEAGPGPGAGPGAGGVPRQAQSSASSSRSSSGPRRRVAPSTAARPRAALCASRSRRGPGEARARRSGYRTYSCSSCSAAAPTAASRARSSATFSAVCAWVSRTQAGRRAPKASRGVSNTAMAGPGPAPGPGPRVPPPPPRAPPGASPLPEVTRSGPGLAAPQSARRGLAAPGPPEKSRPLALRTRRLAQRGGTGSLRGRACAVLLPPSCLASRRAVAPRPPTRRGGAAPPSCGGAEGLGEAASRPPGPAAPRGAGRRRHLYHHLHHHHHHVVLLRVGAGEEAVGAEQLAAERADAVAVAHPPPQARRAHRLRLAPGAPQREADEGCKKPLERLLNIWQERSVYGSEFIQQLKLSMEDSNSPQTKVAEEKKSLKRTFQQIQEEEDDDYPGSYSPQDPSAGPLLTEDLIKALQDLENAASGDATVRQKIASLPQEVQDVSLLEKITDKEAAERLSKTVDEACLLLAEYNGRLAAELEDRRQLARMLIEYTQNQKDVLTEKEKKLESLCCRIGHSLGCGKRKAPEPERRLRVPAPYACS
uniref:Regulation of nuclear pre-mRNA domain containing 1B n=1 Tax=Cairina moschata TaxID=8855 RepID=A0A8C3BHI5_CAIMO